MVAERTFRPPYFHRNVMSEFMGLVRGAYDAKQDGFVPGGASLHNAMSGHGPDRASYDRAVSAELKPHYLGDTLAFMSRAAISSSRRLTRWLGHARQGLRRGVVGIRKGKPVKLASLKGPTRDGTLVVVDRDMKRAVKATGAALTMQHALENWDVVEPKLRDIAASLEAGSERHGFDFQAALAGLQVAAPLPRAYEWLDGSAYLSHVERVRRARNDKVPESFYRIRSCTRAARAA